jgi:hypothetical protein
MQRTMMRAMQRRTKLGAENYTTQDQDEIRKNDDLINKLVQTTMTIEDKLEEIDKKFEPIEIYSKKFKTVAFKLKE